MSDLCATCRLWTRHASEEPLTGMCRSKPVRREARRELGGRLVSYVITFADDVCVHHIQRVAEVPDAEAD